MVKSRLGDEVIINQIQNNDANFSLGYRDLISLRSQGVSDKVLAAMQAKTKAVDGGGLPQKHENGAHIGPADARGPPLPCRDGVSENWQLCDVTDVMSDTKHFEAHRSRTVPDGSGAMDVVATCDAVSIAMTFTYIPNDQQTGFKKNWDGNIVTGGGLLGALAAATPP
jgi:hypothetical protein